VNTTLAQLVDGNVVLIKRRYEPLAGQWSLPGGTLEVGETLEAGAAREILEETGLVVEVGPVIEVFDRILVDPDQRVRYHFVLIDYLCRPIGGALQHGSDVDAVTLADPGPRAIRADDEGDGDHPTRTRIDDPVAPYRGVALSLSMPGELQLITK
jgi:ADP-ribose pyrophosphatase YjhB (NUDIX family)